jgi:hypothetical protein
MRFPWANILLLLLLLIQLVTGYWGMVNGRHSFRWVLWLHGIGAYGIVILLFWKSDIILDAWRRRKRWTGSRFTFVFAALLLLLTLALGLMWTFQGPISLFGFSLVSLHIYLAIPLMILMLWHSWRMWFIWRVPGAAGRRLFLSGALFSLAGLSLWWGAGRTKLLLKLSGASRRFTGSYETGSDSGRFPVVSWIADRPRPEQLHGWRLRVSGAVQKPMAFSAEQLSQLTLDTMTATLDCTGGWYTTQDWVGVSIDQLLEMAGIKDNAGSITFRSVTGYQRRFSVAVAKSFLLALEVAGQPLSHGHGAPARLVASGRRGLEWVKWVTHIRVNRSGSLWQWPLPVQ